MRGALIEMREANRAAPSNDDCNDERGFLTVCCDVDVPLCPQSLDESCGSFSFCFYTCLRGV
jgi:hypothetical protein